MLPHPLKTWGCSGRVAAAYEREPPSIFQSVSVLWNVANVEAKKALASVGGPGKIWMDGAGRGGGADGHVCSVRTKRGLWAFLWEFCSCPT